jgi:uncharacterized protein YigA (DUF484 family)
VNATRALRDTADSDLVAAFLRANPAWLAEHPDLYHHLVPPKRVHGEAVADHMAAMLRAARAQSSELIGAGRAAAGMAARVQSAVLALMRAADKLDCIAAELPGLLGVDAAALCVEDTWPGCHPIPATTVARLLDGRDVVFRQTPQDTALLHAEAARLACCDALVRVPGQGPPALLALASRDPPVLDPAQGCGALAFLGRAVAAALGR